MWQPNASIEILKKRSQILASIREFFSQQGFIEVEVPVLGEATVSDPFLEPLVAMVNGEKRFLQTSPEYYMKRLICAGAGSIYYLGKAFRSDELGRLHNPEFTMLEWYQLGFDDRQLMAQVESLFQKLDINESFVHLSYQKVFEDFVGINPHQATVEDLKSIATKKLDIAWDDQNKNTWLDLLFTHLVEPKIGEAPTFIYDYPTSQAALAKIVESEAGVPVARRFELFWKGMELGNAYWELSDAMEQKKRFEADNALRKKTGKPNVALDQNLIAALEKGLPEAAGIAIGMDRLVACMLDLPNIQDQLSFY